MCQLPTADTAHKDALGDLQYVEGKLKRNEDSVHRATLLLTMPKATVPRVKNRLRKAGAIFREATFEHMQGRWSTLPIGGLPSVGASRPYDGASIAAVHPFGQSGLRNDGVVLGTAREAPEVVMLDISDKALYAKMIALLGTTGAGKTFLLQMFLVRSGLPFTLIDLKPHLSDRQHGDYWPLLKACGGDYIVVSDPLDIPFVESDALCYNLAALSQKQQAQAIAAIADYEWARQLDSLESRAFGCDEANILAKTQAGRDFIERVASQGRNANIVGIFASQEVWDFLKNEQTRKAINMSPVVVVLAQAPNEVRHIVDALQLGEAASAEVMKFQPNPGDIEGAQRRSAVMRVGRRIVSFNIEACPEEQALYTTDPDEKRARRETRELVTA
jgi:type IV secretory pathway VirB4 component